MVELKYRRRKDRKSVKFPSYQAGVDANKHGISYITFYMRVNKLGWSKERALTTPARNYVRKELVAA